MYQQQQGVIIPRNRRVGGVLPIIFPILLAVFQMILTLAIIGLESGSIYYDAGRGTIYAGFWCSVVFCITWIAMFCYVCCRKSTGFGIYLIVQNIINLIFVIILIVYTVRFINNPCLCYSTLCNIPAWDQVSEIIYSSYYGPNCTTRTMRKVPVLKGLLSCAVLMLVSNVIFIVVYIIAYIWSRRKLASASQYQPRVVSSRQPSPMIDPSNSYQHPYLVRNRSEPYYYSPPIETIPTNERATAPIEMQLHRF